MGQPPTLLHEFFFLSRIKLRLGDLLVLEREQIQTPGGLALSLVAIPGLLFFLLPILVAKRERDRSSSTTPTRVALHDEAASDEARASSATPPAYPPPIDPCQAR